MAYGKNRKVGGSMSGRLEKTPARLKRERNRRKNEEARWRRLNGPVSIRNEADNLENPK